MALTSRCKEHMERIVCDQLILSQIRSGSDFYQSKPQNRVNPRGRRTDIITYVINDFTIKGNYKPNLLAFLLQIINVLPIISEHKNGVNYHDPRWLPNTPYFASPTSPTVHFTSPFLPVQRTGGLVSGWAYVNWPIAWILYSLHSTRLSGV